MHFAFVSQKADRGSNKDFFGFKLCFQFCSVIAKYTQHRQQGWLTGCFLVILRPEVLKFKIEDEVTTLLLLHLKV